jgi:HEAT repeat protein
MKVRLLLLLIGTAAVLLPGCFGDESPPADHFGESVPIADSDPDPLTHALQILGLQEGELRRPYANEEDYRTLARLPLVDQLSSSPFILQHWAEETSLHLQQAGQNGIGELLPAAVKILNGRVSYPGRSRQEQPSDIRLVDAYGYLCDRYNVAVDQTVIDSIQQAGLGDAFERELAHLVIALTDAARLLDRAYAGLSAKEAAYLTQQPERYFYPDGLMFNFLTAPTHTQTKILSIAQKIDFSAVSTAACWMSAAVDSFIRSLSSNRRIEPDLRDQLLPENFRLEIPTVLGSMIIAGMGDDHHTRSGALIVDLGGNDTYALLGRAGRAPARRVSVLIDLAGNDVHDANNSRSVQGFGNLSVDLLIDRQGDDRYRAGDMAQGCGMFGIGVLADYDGNDTYEMGLMGQGFGLFGVGLLIDRGGDDRYTVTGLGQGVGSTMGAGILCDGAGADKYLADRSRVRGKLPPDDWSHVQGTGLSVRSPDWGRQASLYGGVGLLSDGGGNDFYFSSHENCMGASYFLSVGSLVDHGGNDWYIPDKGLGIGFAIHLGSAVFVDHQGDDRYYGNLLSGGAASDRSIAVMVDRSGNDIYGPGEEYLKTIVVEEARQQRRQLTEEDARHRIRERLAQNAYASARKPKAFALLIDYRGNDRYTANPDEFGGSFGGQIPPAEPQNWSHAVLFDLGGDDEYSHPGRENGRYFKSMGHGLLYDTESEPSVLDGRLHSAARWKTRQPQMRTPTSAANPVAREVSLLGDPDTFKRFSARGRLVATGEPEMVRELLRLLMVSEDKELNREILEVVTGLLFAGKMPDDPKASLKKMLDAKDPEVRIFSAGEFGRWRIRSALSSLIQKGKDPNEAVRIQVIRAIGQIAAGEAIDFLLEAGSSDPSLACRREALLALSRWAAANQSVAPETARRVSDAMSKALEDEDEVIRTAAAGALACCGGPNPVREALDRALTDESVYVQRAAARSLIFNGFKSGIPALIETLQFPSIDTRQHYDHELAVDLSYFCGVDFPAESRYEHATWKSWWDENREKVDLQRNLHIRHQIERAFAETKESEGIEIFEDLRRRYPHNVVIRNRYVQYCSEWIKLRLLTRKNLDRPIFLRCLRLQEILTQLQPDNADRWVGLAYFQYRLGNLRHALADMETALQLDPNNRSYHEKRSAYRLLLEESRTKAKPKSS